MTLLFYTQYPMRLVINLFISHTPTVRMNVSIIINVWLQAVASLIGSVYSKVGRNIKSISKLNNKWDTHIQNMLMTKNTLFLIYECVLDFSWILMFNAQRVVLPHL